MNRQKFRQFLRKIRAKRIGLHTWETPKPYKLYWVKDPFYVRIKVTLIRGIITLWWDAPLAGDYYRSHNKSFSLLYKRRGWVATLRGQIYKLSRWGDWQLHDTTSLSKLRSIVPWQLKETNEYGEGNK